MAAASDKCPPRPVATPQASSSKPAAALDVGELAMGLRKLMDESTGKVEDKKTEKKDKVSKALPEAATSL